MSVVSNAPAFATDYGQIGGEKVNFQSVTVGAETNVGANLSIGGGQTYMNPDKVIDHSLVKTLNQPMQTEYETAGAGYVLLGAKGTSSTSSNNGEEVMTTNTLEFTFGPTLLILSGGVGTSFSNEATSTGLKNRADSVQAVINNIDNGTYWENKAAEYLGNSWRDSIQIKQ